MSAIEGEGSTFAFFFKVRRSDGSSEDGRPPFQSRSSSETSTSANRAETPTPRQRPGYSRANSNLQSIKERLNEHSDTKSTATNSGHDPADLEPSINNPPTEYRPEAHPEPNRDNRYDETEKLTRNIKRETPALEQTLPNLKRGETDRQEASAGEVSRSQSDQRSETKQTLLLVEDNLINQKVLRRQLQSRGFEVFTANNGQEAIDAVAQRGLILSDNPHDRNYFDCILMDQEMPIKDGNTATQEIRQLQQDGKAGYSHILGVSANVRETQTRSMRDAGMDDVISKPFKVDDLVKKVQGLVLDSGDGKHNNEPNGSQEHPKGQKDDKQEKNTALGGQGDGRLHPESAGGGQENNAGRNGREGENRGGERSRSRQTRT